MKSQKREQERQREKRNRAGQGGKFPGRERGCERSAGTEPGRMRWPLAPKAEQRFLATEMERGQQRGAAGTAAWWQLSAVRDR